MMKSDRKVRELAATLAQKNNSLISEAIGLLRDEEPFEGVVGLLAAFYDKTEDRLLRKKIESFMNDLKDRSVRSEIMTEIRKPFKQSTINMLISSCWQSGMNYSEYTGELVEMFLNGDYATALECFSVLEESVGTLSKTKRKQLISMIEKRPLLPSEEKTGLTNELISILSAED